VVMRTPIRLAITVVLVAAASAGVWLALRPIEPVYEGKSLIVWAEQYGTNHFSYSGSHPGGKLEQEAQTAIRNIGTNAIPFFLEIMHTKPSPLRQRVIGFIPIEWEERFNLPTLIDYLNELNTRRGWGAAGIMALGSEAKPAIPALLAMLTDSDPMMRVMAVLTFGELGPPAKVVLPDLIKCTNDSFGAVKMRVIISLGKIHEEPEKVVPILIRYLTDKNWNVRVYAVTSLGQFGPEGKLAVPQIASLLNDQDFAVRGEATNALKAIDLEAAAKAGVK
jgi:hypothetical protein